MGSNRFGQRYRDSLHMLLFPEDLNHIDEDVEKAIHDGWITFNELVYALAKDEKCFNRLAPHLHDSSITEPQTMKDKLRLCLGILEQMKSEYPGFPQAHFKEGNKWRTVDVAESYKDDGKWIFNIDDLKQYFKSKDIPWLAEDIDEKIIEISTELQEPAAPTPTAPVPVKTSAVNFFHRQGDFWHIGFAGKDARIKHVVGIQYIGYLLEKPGITVSCRDLYRAASGATPDNVMSEGAAISEGLNIGRSKQSASDYEARQEYLKRYQKLAHDLDSIEDNPEGETIRKEIEKEMAEIEPFLVERALPNKETTNQQSSVKKALDRAYVTIKKAGRNDMEKHLQAHIKPGGYNLTYTGDLSWDIAP
jgi:hypothetical protein